MTARFLPPKLLIGLALFVASCASAPTDGTPTQHSAGAWSWWGSNFAGVRPDGSLTVPTGDPGLSHVDYVTKAHSGPIAGSLTVTYRVDGTAALSPNVSGFKCPCGTAVLHLFIGQQGYNAYNMDISEMTKRWWSVTTGDLSPGEHTLTVPLDPAQWGDVDGKRGDTQLAGFKAALANVGSYGVTFGASQGPAGHGVSAAGPVTFTIESLNAS